MTEKRFTIICDDNIEFIMQTQLLLPIYDDKERLSLKTCCDLLNHLHEENQQLQERNDRQSKQLDNLYTLIEKQDWKTLKGIIQEFQECDERLQKEC